MATQVQKWGNSQGIRLPKQALKIALIKENDKVNITATENQIIITKIKSHKPLEERFQGYEGDYKCTEYDWGKPSGKEVW